MKRILSEFEFSAQQLNIVRELAADCNLCEDTVKILFARGMRDRESILNFLHPSKAHFISPFKMSGMREAVELISRARDEGWCVVVYGDYDADGVCAATIMGNALKDYGIQPVLCVPERRNGYGLTVGLIDELFEEYFPQLIITVDCGISCAGEVEYIKEHGAEVIVTDHHELPDNIPDCICINPKFNDGYIYDNLCGAGVAFKVAQAILGEEANKYLDFTAIATVADSVPLTGENRDIVYEGLKLINSKPRACYSQFYKEGTVTSQTLAFSIAPKINAAGRMGDAKTALELFNEDDKAKTFELAAKLTDYNIERQKCCDELYLSAKKILAREGVSGKIIILSGEDWNSGFVGIVAARLADEFSRPVILFVRNGDMLRGSARSVENVNIFEALKFAEEYIEEFGGHSQAAGVNVSVENFEALKVKLNDYMALNFSDEDFCPTVVVSGEMKGDFSPRFARELEMLEPFGVGNKRPLFYKEESAVSVRPVKAQSAHLTMKSGGLELMFFGGSRYAKLMESSAPKKIIFEYNVSNFRGREYVKGFIREVLYDSNAGAYAGEEIALNNLGMISFPAADCSVTYIDGEEVERAMAECPDFGTLFIAGEYGDILQFKGSEKFNVDLFFPSLKNGASGILISPCADADLSVYKRLVFLYKTDGVHNFSVTGKHIESYKNPGFKEFKNISTDRLELLRIFSLLSANINNLRGASVEEVAKYNDFGCSALQVAFALYVFEELGLCKFENGSLTVFRGIKTDLNLSGVYNTVCKLRAEEE